MRKLQWLIWLRDSAREHRLEAISTIVSLIALGVSSAMLLAVIRLQR